MIEQVMFFVLGVLVATLVALMVLPAIWHRAVRLTTRRIEAAVPTSIFEIHADKDLQRASFALNQRRLEIQIETLRDQLMRDARTLEEHRLEAVHLGHQLAARTDELATLTAERNGLAARLDETERTLEERTASLAQATVTLAARDEELREVAATLADTRRSLSNHEERVTSLSADIMQREAKLAQAVSEAEQNKRALAEAQQLAEAEKAEAALQMDATRLKLSAAEAAAEAATTRAHALIQSGASAEELSLVRQRLAEIASRIAAAGATSVVPEPVEQAHTGPKAQIGAPTGEEAPQHAAAS